MADILIVDDEEMINDLISMNLQMVGHNTMQVYSGSQVLEALEKQRFDLILLDIMLPEMDGFELLPYIVERGIPVIYLTAKASLTDKVKGLKLGADDYITKPFEAVELLARIEAVLRRNGRQREEFTLKGVQVRLQERSVLRDGEPVELTAQEFSLLEVLIHHCNIALTREQLLEKAWGYTYNGESRAVDIHIQRLRKKLDWEDVIQTVYKYGYRLEKKE